jgi:hypothetical protein
MAAEKAAAKIIERWLSRFIRPSSPQDRCQIANDSLSNEIENRNAAARPFLVQKHRLETTATGHASKKKNPK